MNSIREKIMAEYRAKAEAELGEPVASEDFERGTLIQPEENPFDALGLPNAKDRGIKLELTYVIKQAIQTRGLSQVRTAELTGLSQPDISKLVRGQVKGFSLERLIEVFLILGGDLEVRAKLPNGKLAKQQALQPGAVSLVAV